MSDILNMSKEEQNTVRGAAVLANAGEFAAAVIGEIAGNDISTAIGGNKLTTEVLQSLLHQRIQKRLALNAVIS